MAKKQTKKVEEIVVVPVKKTRTKVTKPKVEPQPVTPPVIKKDITKSKIKTKKEEVKVTDEIDLITEIKVYQAMEANLKFDNETLNKQLKEKVGLLNTSLKQLEIKQKQLDKLNTTLSTNQNTIFILKEEIKLDKSKIIYLEDINKKYESEIVRLINEHSELKDNIKNIIVFIKYYKEKLYTKYGPTPVNIIFSLIMFVLFGISILTAFGFKHVIGDTGNVSMISILSICSSTIGYFLYLVNWKK
jgi:hypothetical protein